MKIREIMTQNVQCVAPDTTLAEAACKMKDLDVGVLPVCEQDRILGMLTDRDIALRAVAEGKDPKTTTVRDAMTLGVESCNQDEDVAAAARKMRDRQIRRLVVLDDAKRLVGIISLGDLAVEANDDKLSGRTLEAVSLPG